MLSDVVARSGLDQVIGRPPGAVRYVAVAFAVGVYTGLGFLFRPDANTYLLLGIPITVLFQVVIARRPLRALWLSHGQPWRFDRRTLALMGVFLIGPVLVIVSGVRALEWPVAVYGVAAILGALGAAFAFRVLSASQVRQVGLLFLLLVPISLVRLLLQAGLAQGGLSDLMLGQRLWIEARSLLFYVPASFVVEEVFFRGGLDSYIHLTEQGPGWASAAFVSILWGLWHAPIVGPLSLLLVGELIVVQLVLGLVLSWVWRQTGNLGAPATVHAAFDALRNALLL